MKQNTANGKDKYGSWDPNGLYPIYVISGLAYGCVEVSPSRVVFRRE